MNAIFKELMEFWEVSLADQNIYLQSAYTKSFPKNYRILKGEQCRGLVLILDGALRTFIVSPNGKEINLFVLKNSEFCILSATCILKNIHFDVCLEFIQTSNVLILPSKIFDELSLKYPIAKQFQTELIGERLSRVVSSLSSLAFESLEDRVLNFLRSVLRREDSKDFKTLYITHEEIANALGSAREAVSRVLKELEKQGKLKTRRGIIELF